MKPIAAFTRRPWLAVIPAGVAAAIIDLWQGAGATFLVVFGTITYLLIWAVSGPLSRFLARVRVGIQWKITLLIGTVSVLFFAVSLINLGAMDYMHSELHEILDLPPAQVPAAVAHLEATQHGAFFSLAPLIAVLGGVVALTFGVAIAISIITPVRRMTEAMRRIADGDFGAPVRVDNRDELGDLAHSINTTSSELARLREATLAEERARALRERIAQVTAAQEDERRRISRELHDGLGPSLATIVNRLRGCQSMLASDPTRAAGELEDITGALKDHIGDIRHLINDLRPLPLDQLGLMGGIEQLLQRLQAESRASVSSALAGDVTFDPLIEVTVYRIVQEALSNVQKHAAAARTEVTLTRRDGIAQLTVRDDGRGFDPSEPALTGAGVGLSGMRERAELVGGSLTIASSPGNGCTIRLTVPLARRPAPEEGSRGIYPSLVG